MDVPFVAHITSFRREHTYIIIVDLSAATQKRKFITVFFAEAFSSMVYRLSETDSFHILTI
jgi:hypothetical protein